MSENADNASIQPQNTRIKPSDMRDFTFLMKCPAFILVRKIETNIPNLSESLFHLYLGSS